MIAINTPKREKYETVGDWLDATVAQESKINIVRTLGETIILVPPFPTRFPSLRINQDSVVMFGPHYLQHHILEWLCGMTGETLQEGSEAYEAYVSCQTYSKSWGPKDFVEVNVSKLPILNRGEKIIDQRWQ